MGKANKKNCSLESVVNDANLKSKSVKMFVIGSDYVLSVKSNGEKKQSFSWIFDKNGKMVLFRKATNTDIRPTELIQFRGDKEIRIEERRVLGADLSIKMEKIGSGFHVWKNGIPVESEKDLEEYKRKFTEIQESMCSLDEIVSLLKGEGYKECDAHNKEFMNLSKDINFSIDSKLIALARESKSFDEYMKKANANGYYDMMEIGQNWEVRKNSEFSVSKKKPILTFWF